MKILSIDPKHQTMIIDWGWVTLNHDIPLQILENPQMTKEEMLHHISAMRPPEPVEVELPAALYELVEPVQEDLNQLGSVAGEVLL